MTRSLAYRKEVWLLLHNSESSNNETAAVRLYMDESGTDNPNSPTAVVGGLLINYSHFLHFEAEWDSMLERHGIEPPLHMKAFGKHGRLGGISTCCRKELFEEAAALIKDARIATLEATLGTADYHTYLAPEIRAKLSIYGYCFELAAMMNHWLAEGHYQGRIPFILDIGNPYANDVRIAHKNLLEMQKELGFLHAGGLYFDDDAEFGVLQAADVIAWGVRRLASGLQMPPGMEPIAGIYEGAHNRASFKAEWMQELNNRLLRMVAEHEKNKTGE